MKDLIWKFIRDSGTESIFLRLAATNEFFRRFIPRHKYYSKDKKRISRGGINYSLNLSDYTQWKIYSYHRNSGASLASRALNNHSTVILDIGCNVGEFTFKVIAHSLKQSDKKLTIYAFEPNPKIYSSFIENLSLNQFPQRIQVQGFNIGLGNKKDVMRLNVVDGHSGASSLVSRTKGNTEVNIWPLDQFMKTHEVDRIDFIKIDVECFEPFVLLGSTELIKKYMPSIYLEHNVKCNSAHQMGEDFVFNFLIEHGYFLEAEYEGNLITIKDFKTLKEMGKVDILASPRKVGSVS